MSSYDNTEVQNAGFTDGEMDGEEGMYLYDQYGISIDLNKLTDEQRDIYDSAYHSGYDVKDDLDDEDDEDGEFEELVEKGGLFSDMYYGKLASHIDTDIIWNKIRRG